MSDTTVSPELLEPTLPGAWIAEHLRIWQMNFLKAYDLARFCRDRGLSDFGEEGITRLWQLGLLKADRIESDEEFPLACKFCNYPGDISTIMLLRLFHRTVMTGRSSTG